MNLPPLLGVLLIVAAASPTSCAFPPSPLSTLRNVTAEKDDGKGVVLQPCSADDARQQWRLVALSSGVVTIVNDRAFSDRKCLDIRNWNTSDYAFVDEWHCTSEKNYNQHWVMEPAQQGTALQTGAQFLKSTAAMNNKCLTAEAAIAGSPVVMRTCGDVPSSTTQWHLPAVSGDAGTVQLAAGANPLCLSTGVQRVACAMTSLPFCNPKLSPSVRAADLVSRLTLDEKVAQLNTYSFTKEQYTPGVPRLGIPAWNYHTEGLHGIRDSNVVNKPATLYPQVTGMAATGNMSLIEHMGAVMGRELRAINNIVKQQNLIFAKGGYLSIYGPTMNIVRDPRWGRAQESVSECPWINGAYAINFVTGIQDSANNTYLQVAATCKHLEAYSLEASNGYTRHSFNAVIDTLDLHDTYLPAFRACVEQTDVQQVMCSYNAVNGVPTCLTGAVQNGLLRDQWSFQGSIVSDCDAIADAYSPHNYTAKPEGTAADGILGGCDQDCGNFYAEYLGSALNQSLVPTAAVDLATQRVFEMRFRLGEFDPAEMVGYQHIPPSVLCNADATASALSAARQSMTLLANSAGVLPLDSRKPLALALLGPHGNATQVMMGGKNDYYAGNIVSIAAGLTALGVPPQSVVQGCDVTSNDKSGFAAAVDAAQKADYAILAVGLDMSVEHEAGDREAIGFPGVQLELIQAVVAAVGANRTIVLLVNGGPLSSDWLKATVPTILEIYYPGQAAGTAVAETLFGMNNPAGVLPYTLYAENFTSLVSMTEMGMRPNATTGSPGRTYRFYTGEPLWPFGFGLSFTQFELTWASTLAGVEAAGHPTSVMLSTAFVKSTFAVVVHNRGPVDGDKVVQLFAATAQSTMLTGMQRVHVRAGASVTVTFEGAKGFMSPWPSVCAVCTFTTTQGANVTRAIEPGSIRFWVGYDAAVTKTVVLTGEPTPMP